MTYVIHGATGAQGAPVLQAMQAAGFEVTGVARHPESLPSGIASKVVDYADPASLVGAYEGTTGVFVHLPQGAPDQIAAYAANVAHALAKAKPGHVVISTSGRVLDRPDLCLQSPPESAIRILIDGVAKAGLSHAVIGTRLYLENLLLPMLIEPVHTEGVLRYPLPADFSVSWASHQDVADLAVRLFQDPSVQGLVGLGALPGLTGDDLAAAFSAGLGKPVTYEAITPDQFVTLLTPMFGEPIARTVADLYRAINMADHHEILPDTASQTRLGFAPRPIADWVRAVV